VETKYGANDIVKIGEVIAVLEEISVSETSGNSSEEKTENQDTSTAKKPTKPSPPKTALKTSKNPSFTENRPWIPSSRGHHFYSPLVKKIAKEHHISYEELARIPASGKKDRLQKSDVFKYIEDGRPAQFAQTQVEKSSGFQVPDLKFDKGEGKLVEMGRMRQMIADHMVYSKHTSPHVTAYVEADMTNLVHWRNANKKNSKRKREKN